MIRGDETIAKFTHHKDGGTLDAKLTVVENKFLKDAKVRLYRVDTTHVDDFLESVASRKKPITDEHVGSRSVICCHLMNLAYYHHQPLKWDPANCTFAEGTGNLEWLTGSRRDFSSCKVIIKALDYLK